jgi:uncharacterized repeat protein (TIGR01451 family)
MLCRRGLGTEKGALMRRLTGLLLALPLVLLAVPASASAAGLPFCPTSGPQICVVQATETAPVTVPSPGEDPTYLRVTATVTNLGKSTATHFTITDTPPAGLSVAALSGGGDAGAVTCTVASGVCSYGNLASGSSATIDVLLAVSSSARPTDGDVVPNRNTLTVRVDEGTNDNPSNGGKVDTTPFDRTLNLVPRDGTSVYSTVRAGTATTLTTDKAGKPFAAATSSTSGNEVGTTVIPGTLSQSVLASVRRSGVGACPGTCAMTDWMEVSLPGFADITPAGAALRTTLRVDSTLVSTVKGLTPKSVVVWYQPDLSTPPQALPQCSATVVSNCVTGAQKEKDGDLTVVVVEPHNGRMRL